MSNVIASLADVYRDGSHAAYLRSFHQAGTQPIQLVQFQQPAGSFPDPPTDDVTIALNEWGGGWMQSDVGAGRREQAFRAGDMMIKPPRVATHFAADAPHAKRFLSIPASTMQQLTEQASGRRVLDFGRLHAAPVRARAIRPMLLGLWQETRAQGPYCQLFVDGVLLAITAVLLRMAGVAGDAARQPCGLSIERQRLLEEWMDAHLGENFSVRDMADAVGLSAFHFSRALKTSTGHTPRALVMQRRLARAQQLLHADAMPLAEIAASLGFADQAHFTNCFRRAHGITPGAWRRIHR